MPRQAIGVPVRVRQVVLAVRRTGKMISKCWRGHWTWGSVFVGVGHEADLVPCVWAVGLVRINLGVLWNVTWLYIYQSPTSISNFTLSYFILTFTLQSTVVYSNIWSFILFIIQLFVSTQLQCSLSRTLK